MTASRKPPEIGILQYPGAQAASVYGLVDLLETARRLATQPGGNDASLSVQRFAAEEHAPEKPDRPLAALILPPSLDDAADAPRPPELIAWIASRHQEGTILCSVCAGAFLLAETGLLAGRPATTHWGLRARFSERFPRVELDTQKLLIEDGDIITAGGVMAWVDLGLRLIGKFLGPTTMLATARRWIVDPGGREQRFYDCFSPVLTHGDAAVLRVQHYLNANREERTDLPTMARLARLSERTFLRRFQRATGLSPVAYLQHLRVERARELLEHSLQSFDEIAFGLGYADPGSFRRVFVNVMGLAPGEYRRRFGVAR